MELLILEKSIKRNIHKYILLTDSAVENLYENKVVCVFNICVPWIFVTVCWNLRTLFQIDVFKVEKKMDDVTKEISYV